MGIHKEEGNATDDKVTYTGNLCTGCAIRPPTDGEGDEEDVDDDEIDAKRPNETGDEGIIGEKQNENEADCKENRHHLLIATLQEVDGNEEPEETKETKDIAEKLAVLSAEVVEEHEGGGDQLTDTAKDQCDVGQCACKLGVIGFAVDANANLLKTKADDSDKETKYANGLRIDRYDARHSVGAPFKIIFSLVCQGK